MSVLLVKFVIRVNPLLLGISSLLSLSSHVIGSNTSSVSFHFPVLKDLQSSLVLQLKSVCFLLLSFLFGLEFFLSKLHGSLEKNCILLLLVESLKVIWLNSVRSQHWLFGGRVLSHEIMVRSVIQLDSLLSFLDLVGHGFSFSLLLSKNVINWTGISLSLFASLGMIGLSFR